MLLADQQRPMGMLGTNPATPGKRGGREGWEWEGILTLWYVFHSLFFSSEEVHPRSSPSTVRRIMNAHIPVMGR